MRAAMFILGAFVLVYFVTQEVTAKANSCFQYTGTGDPGAQKQACSGSEDRCVMAKYGDLAIQKCASEAVCNWFKNGFCHLMAGENKKCAVRCCDEHNCNNSWPDNTVFVVV